MQNFGPVHQRGPKLKGSPPKVCLGLRGNCNSLPSRELASAGVLHHCGVASRRHREKCYRVPGSLEISLPTQSPGDGGALECRALPRVPMAPSRVGDDPSARPLPSPFPGEMSVALPQHPLCAGSPQGGPQLTCGHTSGSLGKASGRREPSEGLCRVALTRNAGWQPGFMVCGGGERGFLLRHSSHRAGERKPAPSWLPAACSAFPAAALAAASDSRVRSHPTLLTRNAHAGTWWGH